MSKKQDNLSGWSVFGPSLSSYPSAAQLSSIFAASVDNFQHRGPFSVLTTTHQVN